MHNRSNFRFVDVHHRSPEGLESLHSQLDAGASQWVNISRIGTSIEGVYFSFFKLVGLC